MANQRDQFTGRSQPFLSAQPSGLSGRDTGPARDDSVEFKHFKPWKMYYSFIHFSHNCGHMGFGIFIAGTVDED